MGWEAPYTFLSGCIYRWWTIWSRIQKELWWNIHNPPTCVEISLYQHLVTCRWEKTSNQFFQHKHPCRSEMVFGGRGCGWTNKHVYVDLYLFFIYSLMASKMCEFSLLKTHLMYSKTIDLHVIHIPIFWVNESSTCFWSHRFQAWTTSVFWNCGFCLEPGRR